MQFINTPEFGSPQVMVFSHKNKPIIREGDLLIKVKAIGVNRADILQRQGKYPAPKGESCILGLEVCGEVVDAQDSTWIGKNVFGLVAGGAYAQYCTLRIEQAFILPAEMSYEQGAAVAEAFITAYQSLFAIGDLRAHQNVLIHAGASGVGSAAIQLATLAGANVVVTVGSESKQQFCLELGAKIAINYRQDDFSSVIKKQFPSGVNLVIDCIAGSYIEHDINCLAIDGKIVVLAMMQGRFVKSLDVAKMLFKRATITASTLRNRTDEYKADLIVQFKERFEQDLVDKIIEPIVDKVFDWKNAEQAHQYVEDNRNMGKVVLKIE